MKNLRSRIAGSGVSMDLDLYDDSGQLVVSTRVRFENTATHGESDRRKLLCNVLHELIEEHG